MTSTPMGTPLSWLAAWHLDDPDWVNARKRKWKKIRSSPYMQTFIGPKKHSRQKLENFFLTGCAFNPPLPEDQWQRHYYHPDTRPVPVGAGILAELWLTADDSEENWHHIFNKYAPKDRLNGRREFRRALKALYPDHGNVFGDRDARIYRLLEPVRCRREDYSDQNEEQYLNTCNLVNEGLGLPIEAHLHFENPAENRAALEMAQEWCDSVPGWYEFKIRQAEQSGELFLINAMKWLEGLLQRCVEILASPDTFQHGQVLLSKNILSCLSDTTLPEKLDSLVGRYIE